VNEIFQLLPQITTLTSTILYMVHLYFVKRSEFSPERYPKYKLFVMNCNQSNVSSKSMETHQKQQIKIEKKPEPMANNEPSKVKMCHNLKVLTSSNKATYKRCIYCNYRVVINIPQTKTINNKL
jgi:hypothetical protein